MPKIIKYPVYVKSAKNEYGKITGPNTLEIVRYGDFKSLAIGTNLSESLTSDLALGTETITAKEYNDKLAEIKEVINNTFK